MLPAQSMPPQPIYAQDPAVVLLQQQSEQAIKMIEEYKAVLEGFLLLSSPTSKRSPSENSEQSPIVEQYNESAEESEIIGENQSGHIPEAELGLV